MTSVRLPQNTRPTSGEVEVAGRRVPLVHTYADVKSGEPLAFPCTEPLETVPVELADDALWVASRAGA